MKKQTSRQSPRYHGYHGSSPPLRKKSNAEWWTHDDEVVVQDHYDDDTAKNANININSSIGILDDSLAIASELKDALCSQGRRSVRAIKVGVKKKSIRHDRASSSLSRRSLQTSSREASLRVLTLNHLSYSELKTRSMRRLQNQQHLYDTIRQLKERAIELLKEQQRNIRLNLNPRIMMAKTRRRSLSTSSTSALLLPKLAKLSIGGNSSADADESFSTPSPSPDILSSESTISNESPTGVADADESTLFAFQDGESSFDKFNVSFDDEFSHKNIDLPPVLTPRKEIVSSRVVGNGTHPTTAIDIDHSKVELELFMVQAGEDDTNNPTELDQVVEGVTTNTQVTTRAEQLLTKVEQIISESSRGQENKSSLSLEEAIQLLDLLLLEDDKKEALLPSVLVSTDDLERTNDDGSLPRGKVQTPQQQQQQRPMGIIKLPTKDCDSLSSDDESSTAPSSIATSKESTVPSSSSNDGVGWGCNTIITLDDIIDLLDGTINGGETTGTANYEMEDDFESDSDEDDEDSVAERHRSTRRRRHSSSSSSRRSERRSHHEDRHRSSSANRRRRERRQRHRHQHRHQSRSLSPVEMNKERRYQVSFGPVSYSDE